MKETNTRLIRIDDFPINFDLLKFIKIKQL